MCGGARGQRLHQRLRRGRSPRVRGSLQDLWASSASRRSIPACAGEPIGTAFVSDHIKVDPRVCGGAGRPGSVTKSSGGRSPRVRGSLHESFSLASTIGSIPACAGERILAIFSFWWPRVDPRVCGGAVSARLGSRFQAGRSPRVRGSRGNGFWFVLGTGSIPACAGEPLQPHTPPLAGWVDPRVCGGAR